MSEPKHAVGWRYQQETSIMPGGHSVTSYEVYTESGPFEHIASCTNEGRAALIAATLDMREALEQSLSALEQAASNMTVVYRFSNAGQSILDALILCRAALAKAEGRQP